jgi:hypothetical protein
MVNRAESVTPDRPITKAFFSPEFDHVHIDTIIEQQRDNFQQAYEKYTQTLSNDEWRTALPPLIEELIDRQGNPKTNMRNAARLCALVSCVQERLASRHVSNWEQAAAALHILFTSTPGEVQRIMMGTGEGKTFTIAMASIWRVLHGEQVMIHTDKATNVTQSYNSMKSLYEAFDVKSDYMKDEENTLYEGYSAYRQNSELRKEPRVLYGVWSQHVHLYLQRMLEIARWEATLRGEGRIQRDGQEPAPNAAQIQELERRIFWLNHILQPDMVVADEGDVSVDMEFSEAIITVPEMESFSDVDQSELWLIWKALNSEQTTETFERISEAIGIPADVVEKKFRLVTERVVEGQQNEDASDIQTATGREIDLDRVYLAKLCESLVTGGFLQELLLQGESRWDEFSAELPTSLTRKDLQDVLGELTEMLSNGPVIDWQHLDLYLPPPQDVDVSYFFSQDHPLFNLTDVAKEFPILREWMTDPNIVDQPNVWRDRVRTLSEEPDVISILDNLPQQLRISRFIAVLEPVWRSVFQRYIGEVLKVKDRMVEGNDYQRIEVDVETERGPEKEIQIEVLGADRLPQPGKQFNEVRQVFLHLKHDLPFPNGQRTTASMLPATWYELMAQRGVDLTSISGSQDFPDYVVPSTGEGVTEILRTRMFVDKATKLRGIVDYVKTLKDRPVLLCAQDLEELQPLYEQLTAVLGSKKVIVLDATKADQANDVVSSLGPGKVLLLQISARGLDFGKLLEDQDEHSFTGGVVINASQLADPHTQQQLEGRLGGKRPSGQVVTFTALDDGVAQSRYEFRPDLSVERTELLKSLEEKYAKLRQKTENWSSPALQWPDTFSEAVNAFTAWQETHNKNNAEELEKAPMWIRLLNRDRTLHISYREIMSRVDTIWQLYTNDYEKLRVAHLKSLEYQQDLNLREMYDQRRQQMIIDRAVQTVWRIMLRPDQTTPLGKVVSALAYEDRIQLMSRIFDEASDLYPISIKDVRGKYAGSRVEDEVFFSQFLTDLTEQITHWVELEQISQEYEQLRQQNTESALPADISELSEWLKNNRPKVGTLGKIRRAFSTDTPASSQTKLQDLANAYQRIEYQLKAEL